MKIEPRDKTVIGTYLVADDIPQFFNFCKRAFNAESTECLHQWINKAMMWSIKVRNLIRKVMRFRAVMQLMESLGVRLITPNPLYNQINNLSSSYKGSLDGCGNTVSITLSESYYDCLITSPQSAK